MAVSVPQYDADGTMTGSVDLPESLFGGSPHGPVLHAYVKMYLTNQRQGNAKTKTRAEVSGGGAKPWKQKGTGRARSGSNTSPVWVGGGRAFGPRVRNHRENLPRRVRRLALEARKDWKPAGRSKKSAARRKKPRKRAAARKPA